MAKARNNKRVGIGQADCCYVANTFHWAFRARKHLEALLTPEKFAERKLRRGVGREDCPLLGVFVCFLPTALQVSTPSERDDYLRVDEFFGTGLNIPVLLVNSLIPWQVRFFIKVQPKLGHKRERFFPWILED